MSAIARQLTRWCLVLALPALAWSPFVASGGEREVAGMITEIHVGRGRVEVGSAGGERWRPATPLLTLRDGDTVATTADAWVVVVLAGGRSAVRIDEATSPFVVTAAPSGRGRLHKGLKILETSLDFLATTPREVFGNLGSRGGVRPPVILTPRNGRVLPDSVVFEWRGSRSSRYGVRIVGPDGPVLERADLAATRFEYPSDAPALIPGIRYRFQLLPAWHPPQEVWFEVVDPALARAIQQDLRDLGAALPAEASAATAAVLKTGLLAHHGLLHDARLGVAAALGRHPDEPTLHFLLGEVYTRQGLTQEAAEAFAEARFLLGGR
jgi:hypothetical protein